MTDPQDVIDGEVAHHVTRKADSSTTWVICSDKTPLNIGMEESSLQIRAESLVSLLDEYAMPDLKTGPQRINLKKGVAFGYNHKGKKVRLSYDNLTGLVLDNCEKLKL